MDARGISRSRDSRALRPFAPPNGHESDKGKTAETHVGPAHKNAKCYETRRFSTTPGVSQSQLVGLLSLELRTVIHVMN